MRRRDVFFGVPPAQRGYDCAKLHAPAQPFAHIRRFKVLREALRTALQQTWDSALIRAYAEENAWDTRVTCLTEEFSQIVTADQRAAGKVVAMEVSRK